MMPTDASARPDATPVLPDPSEASPVPESAVPPPAPPATPWRELCWLGGILLAYLALSLSPVAEALEAVGLSVLIPFTAPVALLGACLWFRRKYAASSATLPFVPPSRAQSLFSSLLVVLCAFSLPVMLFVAPAFDAGIYDPLPSAIALVTIVPVAEEYYFRGILLTHLRRWFGPVAAVLLSSLLFALLHHSGGGAWQLFVLALAAGGAAIFTRSLAAPIQLHALWNTFAVLQGLPPLGNSSKFCAVLVLLIFLLTRHLQHNRQELRL